MYASVVPSEQAVAESAERPQSWAPGGSGAGRLRGADRREPRRPGERRKVRPVALTARPEGPLEPARDSREARSAALTVIVGQASPGSAHTLAHDGLALICCFDGAQLEIAVDTPGGERPQATLNHRHVSIVAPGAAPRMTWRRGGRFMHLLFSPQLVSQTAAALGMRSADIGSNYTAIDPVVWQLSREVDDEMRKSHVLSAAYLESVATIMVRHVLKTCAGNELAPTGLGSLPQYLVRRSIEFIDSRLDQEVTLADLAATARMSRFHYARLFKRATGETPHRFVLRRRIARAKALLAETAMPITEVAARVGYQSQSHFTTSFGRFTGLTPARYRRGL